MESTLWQGRDVAVKMMQGEGASNMDSLYKEVELLARIDHPCIVRLYACCLQVSPTHTDSLACPHPHPTRLAHPRR